MRICNIRQSVCGFSPAALVFVGLFAGISCAAQRPDQNLPSNQAQKSFDIPVGTILPARLNQRLSSKTTRPGQAISGRIMQDVPLPKNGKIPAGSRLFGTVVSVQPAASGGPGKISFRFDSLAVHRQTYPIAVSLRALAGFMEVQAAETPTFTPGFGTPYIWANTVQIGGDAVYGVGGPVINQRSGPVGKGIYGGVLVHVRAQPESQCRGTLDAEDRLQALWVFSSDACGVYGMEGVNIAHKGRTEPIGEIQLAGEKDVLVRGASAMLLRVVR